MVRLDTNAKDDNTMKTRTPHRQLRQLTVLLWIPTFALLLPHGIETQVLCPVLGILPMSFSAVFGIMQLLGYAPSRAANTALDAFIATFLISILIPSWIILSSGRSGRYWHGYNSVGDMLLGTYGTVPMMVSFALHSYFALPSLWAGLCRCFAGISRRTDEECPYCHGDLSRETVRHTRTNAVYDRVPDQETGMMESGKASNESKETFHSSLQEQQQASTSKDPRPSTDDENVRLL